MIYYQVEYPGEGESKVMMFVNKVLSYLDNLSREIAVHFHVPWAEKYIPVAIAVVISYALFVILRSMLRPAHARVEGWLYRLKRSLQEKARTSAERKSAFRKIRKALAEKDYRAAADLHRSINDFPGAARLYLEAKEFAFAAKTYEDMEDYGNAAMLYREAGNNSKAAENFLRIQDYTSAARMYEKGGFSQKAAELYERAGEFAKSAELFEVCFVEEGLRSSRGSARERYGFLSGKQFHRAGKPEEAIRIFLKAGLPNEAALIYEEKGDFIGAAECYVEGGNLENAAECFRKGGDLRRSSGILAALNYKQGRVKEAASCAEEAGELLQAAEMFAEAGDYAKAGELLMMTGYFNDAGEMFLKVDDFLRAAEAYEKGGRYGLAAEACEKVGEGKWTLKAGELYEKGGHYFEAGEIFLRLGRAERALSVLQRVDGASEHYRTASILVGRIFFEKGMIKLAAEKFSKIIGSDPVNRSNLEVYYYLGRCYEASGERERARAVYEKILSEDYHFKDVTRRLQDL